MSRVVAEQSRASKSLNASLIFTTKKHDLECEIGFAEHKKHTKRIKQQLWRPWSVSNQLNWPSPLCNHIKVHQQISIVLKFEVTEGHRSATFRAHVWGPNFCKELVSSFVKRTTKKMNLGNFFKAFCPPQKREKSCCVERFCCNLRYRCLV